MKNDLPKFVKVNKHRMNQPEYVKGMLTALAYYRLFTLPVSSDITSITTPGPEIAWQTISALEKYAKKFYKSRGIKPFTPKEDLFPAYATTKAGANGPSAMGLTSLKDIVSLERSGLLDKIRSFSSKVYVNNELFIKTIDDSLTTAKQILDDFSSIELLNTGRLHLLAEGGGKTRVICIPDVWTQSCLKPIHQYLMDGVLSKMPCDGTFGHEVLGNRVRKYTNIGGLYCYDLTAATDRFPLEIQIAVLKPLLGDLVHEWSDLLVNREFTFKKEKIRYAVGQPMGLLSSWAAFSVAHHVIINWCKKDKSFYALIGDDVAMSSKKGAKRYRSLMTRLGVSLNDSKSLIPTRENKVAEIAKRQFICGKEVSPIPPRVLLESTKNLEGLLEFLQVLANRTDKFRQLSRLELSGIRRIIRKNKEFDTDKFQVLLDCPLFEYNPFGPYSDLLAPIRDEVTNRWNRSIPIQTYMNEIDSFLHKEASNKVNQHPLALSSVGMAPSPSVSANQSSPLISEYLTLRRKGLEDLFKRLEHWQTDDIRQLRPEHGEYHTMASVTVPSAYQEILSGPDPLSPKDFMEKRRIRRKQTVDLLYRYYGQSRFAKVR
jgi:hypothetical protein